MKTILKISMLAAAMLVAFSFAGTAVADETTSSTVITNPSDDTITDAVKDTLANDKDLKSLDIEVEADHGVVTLKGRVPNAELKGRAIAVAENVKGVKAVNSELEIGSKDSLSKSIDQLEQKTKESLQKAGQTVEDATITTELKLKYAKDDLVKASKIEIETDNGIVTLRGTVSSQAEADRAIQIARAVDGVTEVRSKLIVRS